MSVIDVHLKGLERHEGARPEEIASLRDSLPGPWPEDYFDCLRSSNGLEGYVGGRGYLWLWGTGELLKRNIAYHVQELLPSVVLFGSDAGPIGFGFDRSSPKIRVVSIELSGLHRDYVQHRADSFSSFIEQLASESLGPDEPERIDHRPPTWLRGKVLHEKHPIVMGGSPSDPANRVLVPRDQHPELTVYWSRVVHRAKGASQAPQT